MIIRADTHVHLYPCHDLRAALDGARARLDGAGAAPADVRVLLLSERRTDRMFAALRDGAAGPLGGWRCAGGAGGALVLSAPGGGALHVLAGRQLVTRERLEVLALATEAAFDDGLSVREALGAVRAAGGVPVLPWAPGKWFFARGRIVAELLADSVPGDFLVGDTALRPLGWPEPALMRAARERGFAVLAGSDPLPFPGEEHRAGRYGVEFDGAFDPARPAASIRALLPTPGRLIGRRLSFPGVVRRLWKNARRRRE
jgi:hypothetical protein